MTTYAPSGRPAWAITCWADDNFIYTELPVKDGPPYITKYPLTENGLGKALGLMRDLARAAEHPVMLVTHPKLKPKPNTGSTPSQRAAALRILKRQGIV